MCWLGRTSPQVTCCDNRKPSVSWALSSELPAQVIPDINSKSHYRSNRSGPQDFNRASLSDLFYTSWSQTSLSQVLDHLLYYQSSQNFIPSTLKEQLPPPFPPPILYRVHTPPHPSSRKGSERAGVGCMTNMPRIVQI